MNLNLGNTQPSATLREIRACEERKKLGVDPDDIDSLIQHKCSPRKDVACSIGVLEIRRLLRASERQ